MSLRDAEHVDVAPAGPPAADARPAPGTSSAADPAPAAAAAATDTVTEVAAAPARRRFDWMDTLRGGAILLMLLWHATSVPRLHGMEVPALLVQVNDAFLPYRMPTLMFLSGLLLPRSLGKPLGEYYRGKLAMIVWPYVLWVAIYRFVAGIDTPLWNPRLYIASAYLWFLFYIITYYLVAPALRRVHPAVPPVVFLVASVLVDAKLPHRMLYFAVFFFAGAWVASRVRDLPARLTDRRLLAVLGVVTLGFAVVAGALSLKYVSLTAPLSFAGILVGIAVAARLPQERTTAVRFVGRNSIVFYTAHFPVMLGVLAVVTAFDVPWWGTVPALLLGALAVCWVLARHRDNRVLRWLFELPPLVVRRGTR